MAVFDDDDDDDDVFWPRFRPRAGSDEAQECHVHLVFILCGQSSISNQIRPRLELGLGVRREAGWYRARKTHAEVNRNEEIRASNDGLPLSSSLSY
jgi:hypothetical protein